MKKIIYNPKEALFKERFSQIKELKKLITLNINPDLVKLLDWDSISLIDKSFMSEDIKAHMSDLSFQIKMDEITAYIYLLADHRKETDRFISFRLMQGMCHLWDYFIDQNPGTQKIPVIIPIALNNSGAVL